MTAPAILTRSALVEPLAIARALYESEVEGAGYGSGAFTSLPAFCKGEVKRRLARGERVTGCSFHQGDGYQTYTLNVDWIALAARVETALPAWRAAVARRAAAEAGS